MSKNTTIHIFSKEELYEQIEVIFKPTGFRIDSAKGNKVEITLVREKEYGFEELIIFENLCKTHVSGALDNEDLLAIIEARKLIEVYFNNEDK